MGQYCILYDAKQALVVDSKIVPQFSEHKVRLLEFSQELTLNLEDGEILLAYLGDAELKTILPIVEQSGIPLGFLPHPQFINGRVAYGICSKLEDAVSDILSSKGKKMLDMMTCNGAIVLNAIKVGEPFTLTAGTAVGEKFFPKLIRFFKLVFSLGTVYPKPFKLTSRKDKAVDTAALGIILVEHGRSSVLTRRILDDSAANDGMMHALILAPRSIFEMTRFLFVSMFMRGFGRGSFWPEYIGHIKSDGITVSSSEEFVYAMDGESYTGQSIEFLVKPRCLPIIPGRFLSIDAQTPDGKERFKISSLPTGESKIALLASTLPWIHHASTEEFKELFTILRENSRASESYLILMILATTLATIGLFANSAPVIIGAMILAPLMAPIISLSMGLLRQHEQLVISSTKTIATGIILALGFSVVFTILTPLKTINSEISARLSPTLLDLGVAVVSGVAGAYAHARSEVARSLAGVAIAVALVPPLAVAGIGMGWADFSVFSGASLLFLTNLTGIVLASALTFLALGYSAFSRARRGVMWALALVILVCIPLSVGFQRMVWEHKIVRSLDGTEISGLRIQDIHVRRHSPLYLSTRLLSTEPITSAKIDQVKAHIEKLLQQPLELEVTIAIIR